MSTLTEAQARRHGYVLMRGDYTGTTDNRLDRWYVQRIESDLLDFRGDGFRTKREALDELDAMLAVRDGSTS